jgi:hypothetical protein
VKRFASYFLYTLLLAATVCACNDTLDIHQMYSFDLRTMPVPERIAQGETAEIRAELVRDGQYSETRYFIHYFQRVGKGELRLDDGRLLTPNDLYPLERMVFRLYYTSLCSEAQTVNVYVEDNWGQVVERTFHFQNENPL